MAVAGSAKRRSAEFLGVEVVEEPTGPVVTMRCCHQLATPSLRQRIEAAPQDDVLIDDHDFLMLDVHLNDVRDDGAQSGKRLHKLLLLLVAG